MDRQTGWYWWAEVGRKEGKQTGYSTLMPFVYALATLGAAASRALASPPPRLLSPLLLPQVLRICACGQAGMPGHPFVRPDPHSPPSVWLRPFVLFCSESLPVCLSVVPDPGLAVLPDRPSWVVVHTCTLPWVPKAHFSGRFLLQGRHNPGSAPLWQVEQHSRHRV